MENKKEKIGYSPEKKKEIIDGKKRKLKKAIIIVVIVFALLGALCGVLYGISKYLSDDEIEISEKPINLDGKSYINYYEPDYSANIFEDKDYLAKNRSIKYIIPSDGSEMSIVLDEYDHDVLTEGQKFFVDYFYAATHGDYEAYGEMFTEEYLDDPCGFEKHPQDKKFPMQRIYDIEITELGRSDPSDTSYNYNGIHAVFGVYEVGYKILKNDGEFRYDLSEGGTIPLIFELVTTGVGTQNEKTLIKNIYKYSDIVG